jgi:hypothetical protein
MNGTCDFCGKDKYLFEATVILNEATNKERAKKFNNLLCPIATFYRCARCRFWHIMNVIVVFWFALILFWITMFCLKNPLFVLIPILVIVSMYKTILDYFGRKVAKKSILDLLNENGLVPEELQKEKIAPEDFTIQNDSISLNIILFATFLLPGFLMMFLDISNSKDQILSLSEHQRLGVGYLKGNENHFEHDRSKYFLETHFSLKESSSNSDTFYKYVESFEQKVDQNPIYSNLGFGSYDSIVNLFLKKVKCIPIIYDSTDKSNGRLLITNKDFAEFALSKESAKKQIGIDASYWKGYDSLCYLLETH